MKNWCRKGTAAVICTALSVGVQGATLWDQTPLPYSESRDIVNQEFPDEPTFDTYAVSDIVVDGSGWHIGRFLLYGVASDNRALGMSTARLNVFLKTSSAPGPELNPSAGTVVPIDVIPVGPPIQGGLQLVHVIANDLDLILAPGNYWIGLTPIGAFLEYGQIFQRFAQTHFDDPSYLRNPQGGFGRGTGWLTISSFVASSYDADLAFRLDAVPEPSTLLAVVAGCVALITRSKRRS